MQAVSHGALTLSAGLLVEALLSPGGGRAGDGGPWLVCWIGFSAAIVKTAAGSWSTYAQKRGAFLVGAEIRRVATDAILAGGTVAAPSSTEAALAVRMREVERGLDEGLFVGMRSGLELVPLVAALFWLSPRLALVSSALLLPFFVLLSWGRRRMRRGHHRATELAEELHRDVDELVRHVDLWRTFGARDRVRDQLARSNTRASEAVARADAMRAAASGLNEAFAAAALLVALAWWPAGTEAPSSMVAFAIVFFAMYRPLRALGDARSAIDRGLAAWGSLRGLAREAPPSSSDVGSSRWPAATLEVSGVAAGMGGASLTMTVEPGEIVLLTGPTGIGKTTFIRTLLGLTSPTAGRLRYGERDLTGAGVGPSERPFAWVPQEPGLVTGTLEENIELGAPPGTIGGKDAIARQALALFGAESLAARRGGVPLHEGELSGGERHWVALARAVASELPVLLLDEPTAGLDPAARERVLDALASLRHKRTIVIVSHQPETARVADRVVELGLSA